MNYYIFALLAVSTSVVTIRSAAHGSCDTAFTDEELLNARTFINDTVAWLKAHNEKKMLQAQNRSNTPEFFKYYEALQIIIDEPSWEEYDEWQARKMYHDILLTPAWKSYLRQPSSVEHWGRVYRDMQRKHKDFLAYHLKIDVTAMDADTHKKFINKLNTIMYLTTFLLNERFKKSNPLPMKVIHKTEDAGKVRSSRVMRQATMRRVVSLKSFAPLAVAQRSIPANRSIPARRREKHVRSLQSIDATKPTETVPAPDATKEVVVTEKRLELRPGEGLLTQFFRFAVEVTGWV